MRSILNYPANELRVNLSRSVENLGVKTKDTTKVKVESEVARKYFGNLLRDTTELSNGVEAVDLDGPGPAATAGSDVSAAAGASSSSGILP